MSCDKPPRVNVFRVNQRASALRLHKQRLLRCSAQMLFRNQSLFDFLAQGGTDPHADEIVGDISICHELFKRTAPLKWK